MRSLVLAGILAVTSTALAAQTSIKLTDLPKKVAQAAQARYPHGKITAAEREEEAGKVTFELKITDGKRKLELAVSAEGKPLSEEEEIALSELPAAVKQAIAASPKHGASTLKAAERITDASDAKLVRYEVKVARGQTRYELLVEATGKIVKEEDISHEPEDR